MTLVQRAYVASLLQMVARGLVAASRIDPVLRQELAGLPVGYRIAIRVWPAGANLAVQTTANGTLRRVQDTALPNLDIRFRHLAHAFLVLSFQEGTRAPSPTTAWWSMAMWPMPRAWCAA